MWEAQRASGERRAVDGNGGNGGYGAAGGPPEHQGGIGADVSRHHSTACRGQSLPRTGRRPQLALGTAALLAAVSCARLHTEPPSPPLAIERLADGVYAVPGDTGRGSEGRPNAGFVVTTDGVVVIDALASPRDGARLLRAVAGVTAQPVRWLVLTHHHPDHHFGAVALVRAGARVVAHPDRATLAAESGDSALAAAWTAVVGERAMRGFAFADTPAVPVARDTTLRVGGREIVLLQPGAAHTPGDLVVWLPAARVLFAGDLLIEDGATMMVDGSSRDLVAALARMDALGARAAVPGHGRIAGEDGRRASPAALIALTRCYVEGMRRTMRRAVAEGTSMNRVLAQMPPADAGRPTSRRSRDRRNAVRVYLEAEREMMQVAGDSASPSASPSTAPTDASKGAAAEEPCAP